MSTDCLTHAARSPGPKSAVVCTTAFTGTYSCGPFTSGARFGLSRAFCAASSASSTIALSESSSNSRVDAFPCFWPCRMVSDSCWSYCTRLTVIVEFAQRVADRSPPSKLTSTASAFTMFSTLSVSALTSSRAYIIEPVKFTKAAPYLQSALRVAAAFTFIARGTQKLFAFPAGPRSAIASLMGAAAVLELAGGALMFAGWFTRPVAFVLAGEMAYAYFTQHWPHGFWPLGNGGELAVLYCFIWLYFAAAGPGPVSIDRR